jgi:hypothetical protein
MAVLAPLGGMMSMAVLIVELSMVMDVDRSWVLGWKRCSWLGVVLGDDENRLGDGRR